MTSSASSGVIDSSLLTSMKGLVEFRCQEGILSRVD